MTLAVTYHFSFISPFFFQQHLHLIYNPSMQDQEEEHSLIKEKGRKIFKKKQKRFIDILYMHDYIGAESCVDLRKNLEDYHTTTATGSASNTRRRERRKQAADRVLPPPIPSCNVPWVMTRYKTSDGRLVIKRERAKRQVCLEKLRSNGRLVLNLVPLDGGDEGGDPEIDGGDEKDPTVEMVHPVDGCCKQSWVIGGVAMPSQWIIRT